MLVPALQLLGDLSTPSPSRPPAAFSPPQDWQIVPLNGPPGSLGSADAPNAWVHKHDHAQPSVDLEDVDFIEAEDQVAANCIDRKSSR
jgi:hypothetical protein